MKRLFVILLCISMSFVLFSCKESEGEPEMKNETTPLKTCVDFINEIEEADIWIMPQTKENLKTTLWGKATISKLKAGEKTTVYIDSVEDGEKYIIRIIDSDKIYYSANDIVLGDDYTILFDRDSESSQECITVLDTDGNTVSSSEAFQGALGAN